MKQKGTKLKGKRHESKIRVGDFNSLILKTDKITRQKNQQAYGRTEPYLINQQDLSNIYRTLYPTTAEYTSFSNAHETFTKVDCVQSLKTSTNLKEVKSYRVCFVTTTESNYKSLTER